MTSMPPGQHPDPFDPLAPMASDFKHESGSSYSTPDPLTKPQPPRHQGNSPGIDYANPTGTGSVNLGPYAEQLGAPTPPTPYAQGPTGPSPYQPQGPSYQVNPYGPPSGPYGAPSGPHGQPSGQYGGYPMYGQVQKMNVPALVGLILSLISLILCYVGFATGAIGAILGWVGLAQIQKDPLGQKGRGVAIAAIIAGIATTLFWGVLIAVLASNPT